MIVIIASRYDTIARTLVTRWKSQDANLLTCEDLSVRGWRYYLRASQASTAVIGGREVTLEEISGVLTRVPSMFEHELLHIIPEDRAYIAAEMTSFLTSWLFNLKCPVLNRPTPTCLSGPNWRQEQWAYVAAQIGIPVRSVQRRITLATSALPGTSESSSVIATIVGDRCFGSVDKVLAIQARRLAEAANIDLLAVQFSGPEPGSFFIGANLWPDLASNDIADAVIEYFQ